MARKRTGYRMPMRSGMGSRLSKTVQSTKRRARKLYDENKKNKGVFALALAALVGASLLGYVKFQKPDPKG